MMRARTVGLPLLPLLALVAVPGCYTMLHHPHAARLIEPSADVVVVVPVLDRWYSGYYGSYYGYYSNPYYWHHGYPDHDGDSPGYSAPLPQGSGFGRGGRAEMWPRDTVAPPAIEVAPAQPPAGRDGGSSSGGDKPASPPPKTDEKKEAVGNRGGRK